MKVLLLSAGLGTRLSPLTDYWPKCMMPVAGRPLLSRWLDEILELKPTEVIINTHHLSDGNEFCQKCLQSSKIEGVS